MALQATGHGSEPDGGAAASRASAYPRLVPAERPPSVDALARSIVGVDLPQPIRVQAAREAIASGDPSSVEAIARRRSRRLLTPVINATGVLLHTNLGRAPIDHTTDPTALNLELDLETGKRGSRQDGVGSLLASACGAEAAIVVNNCSAGLLLVLSALAAGRGVAVSRGELVEIGGGFRVPDVMAQSGANLIEVGTTNRTRLADFARAAGSADLALTLHVHQSNYKIVGFTEAVSVAELATLDVPVVADIGSGLLDAACPWLDGPPPAWLAGEPAAKQTLAAGADLVVFSGDKLLGGPQSGIIAGDAALVRRCADHPLARAVRPGGLVLGALQDTALAYLRRDGDRIPFWRMAAAPVDDLRLRAESIRTSRAASGPTVEVIATEAVPGGGTLPTVTIPSIGLRLGGDRLDRLRSRDVPIIARVVDDDTVLDLRSVSPADDVELTAAIDALSADA